MIRINLLPEARRQAASSGSAQIWAVLYLLASFAWAVVLFLVYLNQASVLEEQEAKNAALQQQIDQAKSQSANIGDVEGKLAKSRQLEEVVTGLQSARQGPVRVLMELSHILSAGRGPSIDREKLDKLRRENPLAGYNPGWDIRRLWVTSFTEKSLKCELSGYGKTNEDVAEFLRRMNLSEIFTGVQLQSTAAASAPDTGLPVVKFIVSCMVSY